MSTIDSPVGADWARLRFASAYEMIAFVHVPEFAGRHTATSRNREPLVQLGQRAGAVDLMVERALLPADIDRRIQSFGGEVLPAVGAGGAVGATGRDAPHGPVIRLSELFQAVELGPAPAHARVGECLVIPEDLDSSRLVELCDALAELPDWDARTFRVRDDEQRESRVFRLTPRDRAAARLEYLRTSPTILHRNGTRTDLFVPLGKRHPLDVDEPILLPKSQRNILHAWLPVAPGRAEYRRFTVVDAPAPLASLVSLPGGVASRRAASGGAAFPRLTLRLTRVQARRRAEDLGAVIYRLDSRDGDVGPAMLRLLDHVEAGLEEMTYFSRVVGAAPEALVEHYLRVARPIADQSAWPELRRFECPLALQERELPLFIAADAEFRPDLAGLVASDSSSELRRQLVSLLRFDPRHDYALVEPAEGEAWKVTILSKGIPLRDVISVMLPEAHRQPIREAIGVARIDLARDKAEHEERWRYEAEEFTRESRELTTELFQGLEAAATQLGAEATAMQARVVAARQSLAAFLRRIDAAGDEVVRFVSTIDVATREVTDPRRDWYVAQDRVQAELTRIRENAETLQRSATERVAALRRQAEEATGAMTRHGRDLAAALQRLQSESAALETESASARAAADAAQVALQQRRERLVAVQAELRRRETQVNAEEQSVDALQQQVDAAQQRLDARVAALTERRRRLEQQETQIRRDQQTAEVETTRLEQLERVTLPRATEVLRQSQERRDALAALRLDQQLTEVNARLSTTQSEIAGLERNAELINRRKNELTSQESALNDRRTLVRGMQDSLALLERRLEELRAAANVEEQERLAAVRRLEEEVRALREQLEAAQAPQGKSKLRRLLNFSWRNT